MSDYSAFLYEQTAPPGPESEGKVSFETWIRENYGRDVNLSNRDLVRKITWDAACAESEAQIVALKSDLTKAVRLAADYGIERDALQAERDALRTVLERIQFEGQDGQCPSCGYAPQFGHGRHCELAAALSLSTPASGEPARKP